jgi:hypothetical protein
MLILCYFFAAAAVLALCVRAAAFYTFPVLSHICHCCGFTTVTYMSLLRIYHSCKYVTVANMSLLQIYHSDINVTQPRVAHARVAHARVAHARVAHAQVVATARAPPIVVIK